MDTLYSLNAITDLLNEEKRKQKSCKTSSKNKSVTRSISHTRSHSQARSQIFKHNIKLHHTNGNFNWESLINAKKIADEEQKKDKSQPVTWRNAATISSFKRSRLTNRINRNRKDSATLSKSNSKQDIVNEKLTRSASSSFKSNEAFYDTKKRSLSDVQIGTIPKIRDQTDCVSWESTLRHHNKEKRDMFLNRMKLSMLPDINNNQKLSSIQKKHADVMRICSESLSIDERKWIKIQSNHWRSRRGYVSGTTAPVKKDDFYNLYDAFKIASNNKSKNGEPYISDKDIKSIALRLGVECSDRDARKMADIFDEDGSRHITFPEMVNVMNRAKMNRSEPLLGSGITLQQLLIANRRRSMLENILKHHKKNQTANVYLSDVKTNFMGKTKDGSISAIVNHINNNKKDETERIKQQTRKNEMIVYIENIESESYLRTRQKFDATTRKANTCPYCNKDFEYSNLFEAHILEKHEYNNQYFTCYQCSTKWIPIADRVSHMMKHKAQSDKDYTNNQHLSVNSKDNMANIATASSDRFKCQYCRLVFPSRQVLAYHHSQHHRPLSLDIFRCSYCDDSFDTFEKVLSHKQEFHSNVDIQYSGKNGYKKGGNRSKYGNEFVHLRAQLDDYDSDNDMSPEEFHEMQTAFHQSESRRMLSQRVNHLGHILDFRAKYQRDDNQTVETLKQQFDEQDNKKKNNSLLHFANLLTAKFSEVVTEDQDQTSTETLHTTCDSDAFYR